ncbi:putative transcriptional regulator [Caldicellulosiruptor saccharolyticus DSM 8903]|uniref:Transcriptional regulator n=1 Tax=Caldicellulosiruptor saccharolyticus (strain ATCC 43494 / DSM 8903 / Tp8T 6331) TaxID=351627 RepID=A4XI24_CALS8|nr:MULTISPECIES: RNA-binding domain-containing protein [Caldicellulosiruptor]ABP66559.1 putative transcriptional regulator [Caldicellulosiruptor saccharolyticus DSM 8903]
MDKYKLKILLESDEGPKLDFKSTLSLETEGEKKELVKDVIAIANSRGGRGYIIFGVEDKTKRIFGIKNENLTEEKIQQIISSRCDPPVSIKFEIVEYEGKKLGILTIYKSSLRPHQMVQNGVFYIRRGSTTDVAKREEIASMFEESGIVNFEMSIIRNAGISDLDSELISLFFRKSGIASEWDNTILLESFGIIQRDRENGNFYPTIAGMLVFGKCPERFIPSAYLSFEFFDHNQIICGNIYSIINTVINELTQMYPQKDLWALFEAIANALVHRDYYDLTRSTVVKIGEKFIEVANPGCLLEGNMIYNMGREIIPRRRNPWIYQKMIILDEHNLFLKGGKGIGRIKKTYPTAKIININSQNTFKIILPPIDKL